MNSAPMRRCVNCKSMMLGRSDKKFCDDGCRSSYNNKRRASELASVRRINAVLFQNRRILKNNNPYGKAKVKKGKLLLEGFDFNYHTHLYITNKGHEYYFCYDYGYLLINQDEVLVVHRLE